MNTRLFTNRLLSLLHIPARIILVAAFLLGSMHLMPMAVASAEPAGSALSFDGVDDYVTFGQTGMIRGTLGGTPTWNPQADSKLGRSSLSFNGTSAYVTFGAAPELNARQFTLETWFYWTGSGSTSSTGTGGITAIPLVTKGRGESETTGLNVNYFLGINGGRISADFEAYAGGGNYPVTGSTEITINTWHHAAVTYDGMCWQLYLDGVPDTDGTTCPGVYPDYTSTQHAGLGTAFNSGGTREGYFSGKLDEVRIWNFARTQAEISASMNSEILTPTDGLIGRWGLNDGLGTTASNLNRLGATSFTLEAWVKRASGGKTMSTGTGGLEGTGGRPQAYPILAKGMGEGEAPANINTNWFLGITSDGFVGADFEDTAGGVNHPAWGTTQVPLGSWHHIAATYDGSCWTIYLDGVPDTINSPTTFACPGATPESTSYQRAALSAGINSTGGLGAGYFSGVIDEARVWNRALSEEDIFNNKYLEITSGDGLVARWGLNENTGLIINSSVGTFPGTLTLGPTWVLGFPDDSPPSAPIDLLAVAGNSTVSLSWTANTETDLAGYNIYRSTTPDVPLTSPINGGTLVTGTSYTDTGRANGQIYYYVITAVDTGGNQSVASNEVSATPSTSLQFNGTSQYVDFNGNPTALGLTSFTLESWIKRTGTGLTMTTSGIAPPAGGTGGIIAVPLITKGRCTTTAGTHDMNYFFGIDNNDHLAADFEDNTTNKGHHSVTGNSTIPADSTWHHVAATYDLSTYTWKLYIDGKLDRSYTLPSSFTPNSSGTLWPAIASALGSTGVATAGCNNNQGSFFAGSMDEVRIWNVARTQSDIQSTINERIVNGSGLVARLGFDEGTGSSTTAVDPTGSLVGYLRNSPTWSTSGAPFDIVLETTAPSEPTDLMAVAGNSTVSLSWTANTELDLAGYNIYRSTTPGVALTSPINGGTLVTGTTQTDTGRANGQIYYYVITAVDTSGNQSDASNEVSATPVEGDYALQFDGTNDYVTFGSAPGLGVTNFTLETWFYWTGGGSYASTGSGGVTAIPLITKGLHESDGSNVDANYFLGITSSGKLAGDFEANPGGQNYPITGNLTVTPGSWHHAAVTYDGQVWRLYLDGVLDKVLDLGTPRIPMSDSIQHAGLATAMNSTGVTEGYFQGMIDEARIWNIARTQEQIRADINNQLYSGTGLIARWGMGEGGGTTIASSVGTFNGTLTNGPTFITPGAPFDIVFDSIPPAAPTGLSATAAIGQILLEWTPNSESDLSGYNIYRGTTTPVVLSPGTKINTGLVLTAAYNDNGVVPGTMYYYAVTAVDTSGNESPLSVEANAVPLPPEAIDLGSSNAYIKMGNVADLSVFTLETWLRRDGTGVLVSTGDGGVDLIPLITNGTSEAETATADINYFLGLRATDGVLCADFEEDAAGNNATGLNHPVCGVTPLVNGTWYHAAATYDGSTWKLYLNGNLEATLVVNEPVNAANTSPLAFGTSIRSNGTTLQGFFDGALDEVRIWSVARSQAEIISTINNKLTGIHTNLAGRWGFDNGEVAGTSVYDTSGNNYTGVVTGTGFSWIAGAPFNIDFNLPPSAPTNPSPAHGATGIGDTASLSVDVADPENEQMTVSFYGRALDGSAGEDFTLIAIPDPQYYASTYPSIYNAQMDWVVANKTSRNIPFVVSLGDNVDTDNSTQWTNAVNAWNRLTSGGVRYGIGLGNHDGAPSSTTNYNSTFGSSLAGWSNYAGRYGTVDYDNTYAYFSGGGMDFIVLFIEYDSAMTSTTHPVLVWANSVLAANPNRRAIVVTHNLLDTTAENNFTSQGAAIFNALKGNANLFLMLGGHLDIAGRRQDTATDGHIVHSLRSDYQVQLSQQSGYLRIMRFSPADDAIYVTTYSPTRDISLTDASNQFSLAYDMGGSAPFTLIGTAENVPSGEPASISWSGLSPDTAYEWYAVASDGRAQTSSDTWSFNTGTPVNAAPVITEGESTSVSMSKNGTPTPFSLTLHATDANPGDTLTWSVLSPASHGTASGSGTGSSAVIGYTPNTNYVGTDSFVVQVSDGNGGTDSITVNVTITAITGLVCSVLESKPMTATTGEKPQSKVWNYAGNWYAVFPTSASGASSAGTWLWRLQGTAWTEVIKLSDSTAVKADVKVAGNLAHALLYNGTSTQLVSVEYTGGTYQLWSARSTPTNISLAGSEIATIDIDSTGRMWLATRQDSPSPAKIVVYYSDAPYSAFQGPVELASGVTSGDDISVVTAMPGNKIGVLWSNQNTKRFGFRVHIDGDDLAVWSADELPASQSAIDNVGTGMADDHLNVKVASDGTLYAAVKTGYDTAGYPKMALLVRRPNGTWDNLYGIDESGTRGIIELDEVHGVLTFIYTQSEGNNPIVYRQSSTSSIAFDARKTLRAESFNDVSSMKTNYNNELVVIYANASVVSGQICNSGMDTSADLSITKTDGVTEVERGDALTYTIVAANLGPESVPAARIVDDLPAELTNVSWTCSGANGGICTSAGTGDIDSQVSLPAGASVTFTVNATVAGDALADISNTASITSPVDVPDPIPANNSAVDFDRLQAIPSVCESDPTLVGCWQMEENGGGTLFDGSSYGNDAAVIGSPGWEAGIRDEFALSLNGSTYGTVPDNNSLHMSNQITIASWVKPTINGTQYLVKKGNRSATPASGYELSLATASGSTGAFFFRINDNATCRIDSSITYNNYFNTWVHVAATYDGEFMHIYVNGVQVDDFVTPCSSQIVTDTTKPLALASQSDGGSKFTGALDDVRIYNRALTLQEIQVLAGLAANNAPVFTQPDPQAVTMSQNGAPNPFSLTLDATDADGDALTWSILTPAAHGTATASGTGYSKSIGYTPDTDYVGADSFVVRVSDGRLGDATLTVNVTVEVSYIRVTGTVSMQGRVTRAGVPVTLTGTVYGPYITTSIEQLSNNLVFAEVVPGAYAITTNQPRYLNLQLSLTPGDGGLTEPKLATLSVLKLILSNLELIAGNAMWTDNVIDIFDAVTVGTTYGTSGEGDVNFDGRVNIQDLALVGGNYRRTSESAYLDWVP